MGRLNVRCCCSPGKILGTIPDTGQDIRFVLRQKVPPVFRGRDGGDAIKMSSITLHRRQFSESPFHDTETAYDSGHQDVETLVQCLSGFEPHDRV